jgi:hypothetical protein
MYEAEMAAQEAGSYIVDNLSFDAESNASTATSTGLAEEVGFDESVSYTTKAYTNLVLETGGDSPTTKPVTTLIGEAHKSVSP